jgi:hypothetical protein
VVSETLEEEKKEVPVTAVDVTAPALNIAGVPDKMMVKTNDDLVILSLSSNP